MPRRTYSSKKGRRRPNQPQWANFEWLVSELLRLNHHHTRNRNERNAGR